MWFHSDLCSRKLSKKEIWKFSNKVYGNIKKTVHIYFVKKDTCNLSSKVHTMTSKLIKLLNFKMKHVVVAE